jgi:hypothetical protein
MDPNATLTSFLVIKAPSNATRTAEEIHTIAVRAKVVFRANYWAGALSTCSKVSKQI